MTANEALGAAASEIDNRKSEYLRKAHIAKEGGLFRLKGEYETSALAYDFAATIVRSHIKEDTP